MQSENPNNQGDDPYRQPTQYQNQQYPYQQPQQYAPPPIMPPPKRPWYKCTWKWYRTRSRRTQIIIAAVIIIFVLTSAIVGAVTPAAPSQNNTSTPAPTQPAAQQNSQPTQAPATPTQAPKSQIGAQVVVGGTDSSFIAKYGQPTSRTTSNGSPVLMFNTGDNNIGQFGIVLVPGTHTVFGVVIGPPSTSSWDAITANTTCINYVPDDSKLDPPKNVTDSSGNNVGLYQSGYSAELANSLSSSLFLDAAGNNPVKAGTFSIKYNYSDSSGTQANLCTIRLGEQSTSA